MPAKKKYSASVNYEGKLARVIERIEATDCRYDWTRTDCYIEFTRKGQRYRFEHSISKAASSGQNIKLVSDLFAQLVLTLEALALASERGIYDLTAYISSFKALPPPKEIPLCFVRLQFTDIPTENELAKRYRALAKIHHPDAGGTQDAFTQLTRDYEDAIAVLQEVRNDTH